MNARTSSRLELRTMEVLGSRGPASHIFDAVISSVAARRRIVDELMSLFGGRTQPAAAHLIERRKLTAADLREAEATLRRLSGQDRPK